MLSVLTMAEGGIGLDSSARGEQHFSNVIKNAVSREEQQQNFALGVIIVVVYIFALEEEQNVEQEMKLYCALQQLAALELIQSD